MENIEIEFAVVAWMDYNDRLYVAKCAGHEFEFVAQYWCSETGKFTGNRGWTWRRGGPKNPAATVQWFTESPAWDAFEAATGVTPKAFLEAFEEFIEDVSAREVAIIADED